jgi:hypothetical protein
MTISKIQNIINELNTTRVPTSYSELLQSSINLLKQELATEQYRTRFSIVEECASGLLELLNTLHYWRDMYNNHKDTLARAPESLHKLLKRDATADTVMGLLDYLMHGNESFHVPLKKLCYEALLHNSYSRIEEAVHRQSNQLWSVPDITSITRL